jgi:4-hydroxy-4-methyl-2-oxoglutarate aldolase
MIASAAPATGANSIVERLSRLSTPNVFDVLDKMGYPDQALSAEIRPLHPTMRVAGPAFTIVGASASDGTDYGSAAFEMFRQIVPGSVLVMAGNGHHVAAPWGENASISAMLKGAKGLVSDTGARDALAMIELGFPSFAAYLSPVFMSGRFVIAGHQQTVWLAGQTSAHVKVDPGDYVIGDYDGVVIVPRELIEPVVTAAEELERIEERIRTGLRTGEDREAVYRRHPKFSHLPAPLSELRK